MRPKNIDETLVTDLCNISIQPLQHMQYPDLLCNIYLRHLQHTSKTLETYAFSKTWQSGGQNTT
jgi:hypothetical protein